jgi:hypothetical protein
MIMRAVVERDTSTGEDDFGQPVKPDFTTHGTFPCWAWSETRRLVVDGDKSALVEGLRFMFPIDADIAAGDQIVNITDRRDAILFGGRLQIETPQFKHDHKEADLEAVA